MERSPNTVIVFDIGGVLSAPEGGVPEVAAALGMGTEQVAAAYWRYRDAYDRGGDAFTYWSAVLADLGVDAPPRRMRSLDSVDAERWSVLAPDVPAFLDTVRTSWPRCGVLSNAPTSMARTVRTAPWSTRFEHMLFSCELQAAKPVPGVYQAVEETFGVTAGDIVFLDDRIVNVEAALSRGWNAVLWEGTDRARQILQLPPAYEEAATTSDSEVEEISPGRSRTSPLPAVASSLPADGAASASSVAEESRA